MLIRDFNENDATLNGYETQKGENEQSLEFSLKICGLYLFTLFFLGDCAQHRLASRTDLAINAQKRLTSRAGVGLACRSCHHFGLRR